MPSITVTCSIPDDGISCDDAVAQRKKQLKGTEVDNDSENEEFSAHYVLDWERAVCVVTAVAQNNAGQVRSSGSKVKTFVVAVHSPSASCGMERLAKGN